MAEVDINSVTEKVADKIVKDAESDIVMEIRQKPSGELQWRIPPNLMQAAYFLKILDIAISQLLKMALAPKPSNIVKPNN